MKSSTTPHAFLMTGVLVAATLASLLAPPAAAHACTGADPQTSCGDCDDGRDHVHRDQNGVVYCHSDDGNPLCPPLCALVRDPQHAIEDLLA